MTITIRATVVLQLWYSSKHFLTAPWLFWTFQNCSGLSTVHAEHSWTIKMIPTAVEGYAYNFPWFFNRSQSGPKISTVWLGLSSEWSPINVVYGHLPDPWMFITLIVGRHQHWLCYFVFKFTCFKLLGLPPPSWSLHLPHTCKLYCDSTRDKKLEKRQVNF